MASNSKKRNADNSSAQTTDEPVKRRRGRPRKLNKSEDTVKLTLKIPGRSDKSTSPISVNSDSEIIDTTDSQSSPLSLDDNDNDLDLVQAATEGLLGLAGRMREDDDDDADDADDYKEQEEEKEEQEQEEEEEPEDEEEEDADFSMSPSTIIFRI
jgi:hypothetical protein